MMSSSKIPWERDVGTSHDDIGLCQMCLKLLSRVSIGEPIGGSEKAAVLLDRATNSLGD